MSDQLVNRVAASGLITLKPEEWLPPVQPLLFDLKDYLFMGMILKEKDFREQMAAYDWKSTTARVLCVYCSADAIIPSWAWMLVGSLAAPHANEVFQGTLAEWQTRQLVRHVEALDAESYRDQRVILKGCSDKVPVGPEVYLALTVKLVPVVKSLMFGEPCSTVPVYKKGRTGA